ncbi:Uncharacterized protein QTN25_004095 [Entamoeba marina]
MSKSLYDGEYISDNPKESYTDIKSQYFHKLNIEMPSDKTQIDNDESNASQLEIEKPMSITKPQEIPRDESSLGEDVLLHMLKGHDHFANSPPL